jgi:DNA (cytosine-5)-methyltransferase 1
MNGVIYNELDSYACAWLRRLLAASHLTAGRVIERDIRALTAAEVGAARRFHAFAGIGLWEHALQLAGWPEDVPVWTGSCPCQPFSVAGRGGGTSDERHLWPAWFQLIRECRPPVVFGEQVASPAGRSWLDVVSADLEGEGYAVGAADLCAAGVGAPHIRQRLYFVGIADSERLEAERLRLQPGKPRQASVQATWAGKAGIMGDSGSARSGRDGRAVSGAQNQGRAERRATRTLANELELAGYTRGFWRGADWLLCRDGKARPVESGSFPLAHGRAGRVVVERSGEQEEHWYHRGGALRCIGNAIVPQVAATFIEAAMMSWPLYYSSASD